ncbi:helix-turn-helix domain-containing protein [Qipengyuania flava]|uniref:Helix-turn-helix domain-containing protein n=1 Tax=Qipengyuania flava TaxID=192812 RepID=A0A5P6N9G1_9SPHN|nr:DNA N-6-adenine-methyltransferase [Qipengyuania flava]QFI62661.1 helix-turn-helix domain-containing protein [Qipengyuania flava]
MPGRFLTISPVSDSWRHHILIDDLRAARQEKGWLQRTLAERSGTSAQAIFRLERGIGSASTLEAAMQALDFRLTGIGPGKSLAGQLRNRRLKRKITIEALAKRTGLSPTTIRSVELGGGSVASVLRILRILAPKAKRRAPERAYWGQGDKDDRDSRFTPPDFMDSIYDAFGRVDLDPCAHPSSPVIASEKYILANGGDGLRDAWLGEFVYVNPPFSDQLTWLRRAHEQWQLGNAATIACLVPARTDSAWFHETLRADADIYFLQGRLRFLDLRGDTQATPFSLMLVIFGGTREQKERFANDVPGFWMDRSEER